MMGFLLVQIQPGDKQAQLERCQWSWPQDKFGPVNPVRTQIPTNTSYLLQHCWKGHSFCSYASQGSRRWIANPQAAVSKFSLQYF